MMQLQPASFFSLSKLVQPDRGVLVRLREELRAAIDAAVPAASRAEFRRALDRIAELEAERDARLLDFERDRRRGLAELERARTTHRTPVQEGLNARFLVTLAAVILASCALVFAVVGTLAASGLLAALLVWAPIALWRRERAQRAALEREMRWEVERAELEKAHRERVEKAVRATHAHVGLIAERWSSVLPRVLPYEERLASERRKVEALERDTPFFDSLAA